MSGAKADQDSFLRRHLLVLIVFAIVASIPLQWLLENTTELSPDHSDAVMISALAMGAATAIALALLVVIVKPASRSSTTITAAGISFCGLILGTLLGMALAGEAFQIIDFSGPNVTRRVEEFAVARAYKTHGKSACDHIQLRDYFGDFCINPHDYETAFADSEDTPSRGYCLRADTERNGSAVRVMHSSSWTLRSGSVVRCVGASGQAPKDGVTSAQTGA